MKSSFKVNQAQSFLLALIRRECPASRTRLPSVSRMATMAGVSYVTMWKAIQQLKRQGILEGGFRSRTMVSSMAAFSDDNPGVTLAESGSLSRLTMSIASRIEKDVLNGLYSPGAPLGSFKELSGRYGVCFATMKKAVEHLIDRGVLCRDRKTIAVPRLIAHRSTTRLTLIGIDAPHEIITLGTVGAQLLQCIEMECARAGIGLDIISFHVGEEEISYTHLASGKQCDLTDSDDTAGYLYLLVAQISSQEAVFRRLQHFKKPVALFDIAGADYPRLIYEDKNFRLFLATASMASGYRIGRFLSCRGHRVIAYFSPYHASQWSRLRLDGLRKGMPPGCAVKAFTMDRITHSDYLTGGAQQAETSSLLRMLKKWETQHGDGMGRLIASKLRACAEIECASAEVRLQFCRFFAEALADSNVTAWVCSNDLIAGFALDFLAENRVAVPGRISVIGFDDSPEAMERRLTSYNFNVVALARAMLDYVLRKGTGIWSARKKKIEFEGIIVERTTTGPARTNW